MTDKHLIIRSGLIPLTVIAVAALATACGSSAGSNTSASASAGANGKGGNRAALVACLRKHGVTLPAGGTAPSGQAPGAGTPPTGGGGAPLAGGSGAPPSGFPGGGAAGSKFRAAFKACGANFPARRPGAGNFSRQNIQRYVTCVRQHGYHLPNPNFSGRGSVFPARIRSNTKFQTASRACQSLLRPTATPTTPTST